MLVPSNIKSTDPIERTRVLPDWTALNNWVIVRQTKESDISSGKISKPAFIRFPPFVVRTFPV